MQAAGIKFTHSLKSGFSPRMQGRLMTPIHVKLGVTDGHVGPFGCANFHLNRRRGVGGWNAAPKYEKFPLFGRVAWRGLLTDF